jgi:uncharacterized protein with PIN domain/sulfur carrier protein ThiS
LKATDSTWKEGVRVARATFRFYEELNDFLTPDQRKCDISLKFEPPAPVGHLVESLGVPHTEIEIILVNGVSVGLDKRLQDGDRVSVYPVFESVDVTSQLKIREDPLRALRFATDSHLGRLAAYLRMLGFDTLFQPGWVDRELAELCAREQRILLTRDRALLMRSKISRGCYVRNVRPREQLAYLIERLDLCRRINPFCRCMACNHELGAVTRASVLEQLPPGVARIHQRFLRCDGCGRVYWEGSHYFRMLEWIVQLCPGYQLPDLGQR